jgi:hypothetical protein
VCVFIYTHSHSNRFHTFFVFVGGSLAP